MRKEIKSSISNFKSKVFIYTEAVKLKQKQQKEKTLSAVQDPDEDSNIIHDYFTNIKAEITKAIAIYSTIKLNPNRVQSYYQYTQALIKELASFINAHSFCSHNFDNQNYQQIIKSLYLKNVSAKNLVTPKKKFAFSSKVKANYLSSKVEIETDTTISSKIFSEQDLYIKEISKAQNF